MSLAYTTITGTFDDGGDQPVGGIVTFTPSQAVYAEAVPVCTPGTPVEAQIVAGELLAPGGGPLRLLATDNAGLTMEGRTGFWFWTVSLTITGSGGSTSDGWSFFLPSSPSSADLYSLAGSPAP